MPAWLARMMQNAFQSGDVRGLRQMQQIAFDYHEYQMSRGEDRNAAR